MRAFCLVFLITINTACFGQGLSALSPEQRVAAAVLPLPPVLRDHASVIELDKQRAPVTIRKGTNGMVCMLGSSLADFDARCYHASFMPLILRVRQLYARGQKLEEADVDKDIDNDVKGKKLTLPDHPTAGYRMLGPMSAYDRTTNTAGKEIRAWQSIHFPYKTATEIGLPLEGEVPRTVPYVMASGTFWSHVMIEHSPDEQAEIGKGTTPNP